MTIRVAYDISFLANFFDRIDYQNGIFRVIEEVLCELSKRDDVELTAMGLCGCSGFAFAEDPLLDSINSYLYIEGRKDSVVCKFEPAFKSRMGLSKLYQNIFPASLSREFRELSRFSPRSIYVRGIRSILYRLSHTYGIDRIERSFDYKKFDVFHSGFLKLPSAELTGGIPRVLTVYDLIPVAAPEFATPEFISLFQQILNSINIERDWVACISEYTKQQFCGHMGMSPDRVFVTPLAAAGHFYPVNDLDQVIAVHRRYGIPNGDYFLSIAAPQPRKNLAHLIRCFFQLLSQEPTLDINLVLVGSRKQGWMYDEIFAAANDSDKFSSRVIFTDYIPDEDLRAIYSGAKAFVFPSLYEGFGLPPLEAMQCGVPVITSNTTSLPEVVGDAGIMVAPKDSDALCQAMLSLATDTALSKELSWKGLKRAEKFSWAKCAADTAEVYKIAVSSR